MLDFWTAFLSLDLQTHPFNQVEFIQDAFPSWSFYPKDLCAKGEKNIAKLIACDSLHVFMHLTPGD